MALPILDGNQTATTLSTVLTSGEHIPAHTVVSLGSVAISNITSAVSGSVVSVSNLPSTQTIAGTVTVQTDLASGIAPCVVPGFDSPAGVLRVGATNGLPIRTATDGFGNPSNLPISGTVTVGNSVTIGSLPAISGTVTANLSSSNLNSVTIGIRGTVTVGNSVTIGSIPAISGTVTANVPNLIQEFGGGGFYGVQALSFFPDGDEYKPICSDNNGNVLVSGTVTANLNSEFENSGVIYSRSNIFIGDPSLTEPSAVNSANPLPISGTVTAEFLNASFDGDGNLLVALQQGSNPFTQPISGTVTANLGLYPNAQDFVEGFDENIAQNAIAVHIKDVSNNILGDVPFPISGTVTVGALPSGALTTRFGSVTTANTAQITSAVTNTNRKYLLAQNISAGTVTIGIGFSPTTTQGIQLTAGGGLTFDAFCPTGAVYWLGAVTGAAFTILEG